MTADPKNVIRTRALTAADGVPIKHPKNPNSQLTFWPLGDRVDVHKLEDEYIPYQTEWGAQAPTREGRPEDGEDSESAPGNSGPS